MQTRFVTTVVLLTFLIAFLMSFRPALETYSTYSLPSRETFTFI
jgi:hypothetical protein